MNGIEPVVRHMLPCDDAETDVDNPYKVNVRGLASMIRVAEGAVYPVIHPELYIYLQVAGGRGNGEGRIVVRQADSDRPVFGSSVHRLSFPQDPLVILGVGFRLQQCRFPQPGLYWGQFLYNDQLLAQQPLLLR
jgi:uncharacterized protein DUF6941